MKIPGLTTSMKLNAAFSAASGAAAAALGVFVDRPFGLDGWFLSVIGVGLVVYGAQLVAWARSDRMVVPGARLATVADTLWVAAAVLVLLGFPSALDTTGRIVLALVSLVVADFAVMQALGLRKLRRPAPAVTA